MFQFIVTHSIFDCCLVLGENKYRLVMLSDQFAFYGLFRSSLSQKP